MISATFFILLPIWIIYTSTSPRSRSVKVIYLNKSAGGETFLLIDSPVAAICKNCLREVGELRGFYWNCSQGESSYSEFDIAGISVWLLDFMFFCRVPLLFCPMSISLAVGACGGFHHAPYSLLFLKASRRRRSSSLVSLWWTPLSSNSVSAPSGGSQEEWCFARLEHDQHMTQSGPGTGQRVAQCCHLVPSEGAARPSYQTQFHPGPPQIIMIDLKKPLLIIRPTL